MIDDILKVWPILAVVVPGVGLGLIWAIRFEAEVKRLKERNTELEATVDENSGKIVALEKHAEQAEKKIEHICHVVVDEKGQPRFQNKDDCEKVRAESIMNTRDKDLIVFRRIDDLDEKQSSMFTALNSKLDTINKEEGLYRQKVIEKLAQVEMFMQFMAANSPQRGNVFNNSRVRDE